MDSLNSNARKLPTLFWFFAGIIGLLLSILLYEKAFPTAHINFSLKRAEILPTLEEKVKSLNHSLSTNHSALTFSSDQMTQYYLELEVGQKKLEELQSAGLNIWYWQARWFNPEQQEEWQAALDPQGRWVSYSHFIEEKRELPTATEAEARLIAEKFLEKNILQHPVHQLHFIETQIEVKPHRKDYTFTWERNDLRVNEASYRLYVTIQGTQVGSYSENLKIPEAWSRAYAQKRELNELCQNAAQYACIPLFLIVMILTFIDIRNGTFAFFFSNFKIWIILMVLGVLFQFINQIQGLLFSYSTTDPWSNFWMENSFSILISALTSGLFLGALFILSSHFYLPPDRSALRFSDLFNRSSLHNPQITQSIGIALLLALAHMGYANGFYLLIQQWGAWCPLDLDYAQILEGPFPWIEGFMAGYSASWMEELLFRVLGVFALLRLTKNRWLSIIVPAVIWAFLHSNYPQSPGYIRGIELTIVGISYGWIMLRYGIVTTLLSHFCYNCWQSLLPVFQVGGWSNWIGSLVIGGWPFALFALGFRKNKELSSTQVETIAFTSEMTASVPPFKPTLPSNPHPIPTLFVGTNLTSRLSGFHSVLLFTLGLVLFALSWRVTAPQDSFIKKGEIEITREQALEKAQSILQSKGINPFTYRSIISAESGETPSAYLAEYLPLSEIADRWFARQEGMIYSIRFFRFGEKEEFQITLKANGELLRWNHLIPREAGGDSLDLQKALSIAEKQITEIEKIDLSSWNRVMEEQIQQEKRRDWNFVWEQSKEKIGEAPLRLSLQLRGSEPMLFESWYKIPEQWIRDQEKSVWYRILFQQTAKIGSLLMGVLYCYLFTLVLQKKIIPWRWTLFLSTIPVLLWILQTFNSIPWFYQGYQTHEPSSFFALNKLGKFAAIVLMIYCKTALQIGGVLGLFRLYFGFRPKHLLCSLRNDSPETRNARIAWVIFYLGLIQAIYSIQLCATGILHPAEALSISIPSINNTLPWLNDLIKGINLATQNLLYWASFIAVALWLRQRFSWALPLYLLWQIITPGVESKNLSEFFLQTVILQADQWILLLLIWKIWKFDWFLLMSALTLHTWLNSGILFWIKGGPYAPQAYGLIVGSLFLLILLCWTRRQFGKESYSLSRWSKP